MGGWDSIAMALTFPVNACLSLQGYEGSLIKLTSRQVISLQGFSSSPPIPTAELGMKSMPLLSREGAETCSYFCPGLMKQWPPQNPSSYQSAPGPPSLTLEKPQPGLRLRAIWGLD